MPAYRYRAVGGDKMVHGVTEGKNEAAIVADLQRRGLMVLGIAPAAGAAAPLDIRIGGGGLRRGELTEVTRELASMLGAGQDLDRALRLVVEGAASRRTATVLGRVREMVRDGAALATALAREPRSFPKLYIGLIRAGEAGGQLPATLERLTVLLERQASLNATVQAAMIYPAILVVAAVGSIILLLTQVLPQFLPLFAQNGVQLPGSTAFLLAIGNAVSSYGLLLLAVLLLAGFAARTALRRHRPRLAAERLLLRLPVVGGLLRDVLAARFARTLGMLLVNGVPLLAALGIAADVLGNILAAGAVAAAADGVKAGKSLAKCLEESAVFSSRLTQLLRLGEETAQLGPMALRAADLHEERTRLGAQRVVALLVPAITVVMGAAVAGIVSSLMLAMLSLNDVAH